MCWGVVGHRIGPPPPLWPALPLFVSPIAGRTMGGTHACSDTVHPIHATYGHAPLKPSCVPGLQAPGMAVC